MRWLIRLALWLMRRYRVLPLFILRYYLRRIRQRKILSTLAWVLFQSARISECIESMVGRGRARRDAREHDDSDAVGIHHERVPEHHGEFARSEWDVCLRRSLLHVETPDALLQREQTLVDLRALQSSLSVVALTIGCSLTARQVHQQQLPHQLARAFPDLDLADCMRTRRSVVRSRRVSRTHAMRKLYYRYHFLLCLHLPLL